MTSSSPRTEILHCVQNDRVKGPSHDQCCLDFFSQDDCCPARLPDPRSRSPIPAAPRSHLPRPLPPERQRRNPWHRGTKARWMPYAPLRRRRRPLREYSRPADWYLLPLATLTTRTEILRCAQDDRWKAGLPDPDPDPDLRSQPLRGSLYLRSPMTKHCIKIHMKFDSANESVLP